MISVSSLPTASGNGIQAIRSATFGAPWWPSFTERKQPRKSGPGSWCRRRERRGQFNVIDGATAWKVDVIFRKARPFSKEEMARRVAATVLGVDVFLATAEDTALAKLEWAKLGESERQVRDVRALLEAKGEALDRAYVERWLDDLGVRDLWERLHGR
jgi:hypothetical protein